MKKITISAIILIFLSIVALAFAETSIKAEVDKKSITTDENVIYKLTITSTDKNIPQPQLPKFTGLAVISQAQSSSISLVKGGIKTILVYAFVLAPLDIGKFKIEPSLIKVKNKTCSTDTFEIEVTQGKRKPNPSQKEGLPLPEKPPSESEEPQVTL